MRKWMCAPLLLALIACSNSSSNKDGASGNTGFNVPTPNDLNGAWTRGCVASGTGSTKSREDIVGDAANMSTEAFASTDCSGTSFSTFVFKTSLSIPGVSSVAPDVFNMDFKVISVEMTPTTQAMADGFNAAAVCGVTDWAAGVAKDVTGKTCSSEPMPSAGDYFYSIGKRNGNEFFNGTNDSTHDGKSVAQRHVTLDTVPYTK